MAWVRLYPDSTLSSQPLVQAFQRLLDLVRRHRGEEAHERPAADRVEVHAGREGDPGLLQQLVAELQARARVARNVGVDIERALRLDDRHDAELRQLTEQQLSIARVLDDRAAQLVAVAERGHGGGLRDIRRREEE